jgi:putative ABC transport system permease protein
MGFAEAIRVALQSLVANKLRTVLTLIGVVIGVASVIAIITLVNGANRFVATKISGYGSDVLTVTKMPSVIQTAEEYLQDQKRKDIEFSDYEYITQNCGRCLSVGAQLSSSGKVVNGKQSADNTTINGWTSAMAEMSNINVAEGRELTPMDDQQGTHDVVVGADIVDNLLPNGDPIGQEIRVDGEVYTVVGVAERQGTTLGRSRDNFVNMPLSTFMHTHGEHQSITIFAKAGTAPGALDGTVDEVSALMRVRRHDRVGEEDTFAVQTNETFASLWKQLTETFAIVVIGIASISLVVGGVVIMNIMLVSVTERTREIGIRKALGAKRQDVLLQFLIESATMALAGGICGVILGVGVAEIVTTIIGWPSSVALWSVVLGLTVATSVGIFFGVYPAHKASMLDPIVALRSEL